MSDDVQRCFENARGRAERATTTRSDLVELSKTYFKRAVELERSMSLWTGTIRGVGSLRDRLEKAEARVAQCERLVTGWREMTASRQTDGLPAVLDGELLTVFEADLRVAMTEKERAQKALRQGLRSIFLGARRRWPNDDQELDDWLASAEGKTATVFEPAPLPPSRRAARGEDA